MICEKIKETREKNGLTQAGLAKKLGISRSAVNSWEIGISAPSVQYLIELSKLFKVSTDYLLELNTAETVDISFLNDEEKRMIYSLLDYFQKYGNTMRRLCRQAEANYDVIKKTADEVAEPAAKNVLEELLSICESLE